jgi:cyclohexadienyl dehydratase
VWASVVCASAAHAEASFVDPAQHAADVFTLIDERLELMQAVAAWKYAHNAPVLDEAREREILETAASQAGSLGIAVQAARELFELQLRWARETQEQLIGQWRAAGVALASSRDLRTDLRPALDELGRRL